MTENAYDIKKRIIDYISYIINDIDDKIEIKTNEGTIIELYNSNNTVNAIINNEDNLQYRDIQEFKITTLYQIIENIKYKLEFDNIVNQIKKKDNYWDKKRRVWTHKPINKKKIMEKVKYYLRDGKIGRTTVNRTNRN